MYYSPLSHVNIEFIDRQGLVRNPIDLADGEGMTVNGEPKLSESRYVDDTETITLSPDYIDNSSRDIRRTVMIAAVTIDKTRIWNRFLPSSVVGREIHLLESRRKTMIPIRESYDLYRKVSYHDLQCVCLAYRGCIINIIKRLVGILIV